MSSTCIAEHPYQGVDVAKLDEDFASLLVQAEKSAPDDGTVRPGLSEREKRLFRFGLLVGQGEWLLARQILGWFLETRTLTGLEVERAVHEAVVVKGLAACVHLFPVLMEQHLRGPGNVLESVTAIKAMAQAQKADSMSTPAGLTEREIFSLGFGVSLGDGCWDT